MLYFFRTNTPVRLSTQFKKIVVYWTIMDYPVTGYLVPIRKDGGKIIRYAYNHNIEKGSLKKRYFNGLATTEKKILFLEL